MYRYFVVSVLLALILFGCQAGEDAVETVPVTPQVVAEDLSTKTPLPTETPEPTETAVPTNTATPQPTDTAVPTETPAPTRLKITSTPVKMRPTSLPEKLPPVPTSHPLTDNTVDVYAIIEKAQTISEQVESMHLWMNMLVEVEGITQDMTMDCDVETISENDSEPYENMYCQVQVLFSMFGESGGEAINLEMIQLGSEAWMRVEGEEMWMPIPQEESSLVATDQLSLEDMEPYLEDAQIIGETEIDGVVVYEIEFDMDVFAFMTSFMGQEFEDTDLEELDEFLMTVRYWIGQDDLLTRKAVIDMALQIEGEPFNMLINMALSNYNEPVKIPNPGEADAIIKNGL